MTFDGWTSDTIENAITLWKAGQSSGQIALAIGCSRNAAIGKLSRLGYKRSEEFRVITNQAAGRPQKVTKPKKRPKPSKPLLSPPMASTTRSEPIGLLDLKRTSCRWPVNSGEPEWLFCGDKAEVDRPYCPAHGSLARREVAMSGKRYVRSMARVADHVG